MRTVASKSATAPLWLPIAAAEQPSVEIGLKHGRVEFDSFRVQGFGLLRGACLGFPIRKMPTAHSRCGLRLQPSLKHSDPSSQILFPFRSGIQFQSMLVKGDCLGNVSSASLIDSSQVFHGPVILPIDINSPLIIFNRFLSLVHHLMRHSSTQQCRALLREALGCLGIQLNCVLVSSFTVGLFSGAQSRGRPPVQLRDGQFFSGRKRGASNQ